jgi:hypothetical protein
MCSGVVTALAKSSKPLLADVTLVAVTSIANRATVKALRASMDQAQFAQVLMLSDRQPPADLASGITWRRIERLDSRAAYSRFMLRDLAGHIATDHVLCVQWDGFVLNGNAWDSRFLEYDYIGAVWPQFDDDYNVGNGGFSLRSRRLLAACTELPFDQSQAEDVVISRLFRRQLEEHGIRFAPESLARAFAYERTEPSGREFGFHGAYNLVRYLPGQDADRLFRTLESGVLTRRERLELLRWAVRQRRFRLAMAMATRLA